MKSMIENQKKVSNINNHVPEKSELKERGVSVFKFGAEARKTVSDGSKSVEKKITSKEFKCEQCNYESEQFCMLKKHMSSHHT